MKFLTELAVYCIIVVCMWIGGAQMATAQSEHWLSGHEISAPEKKDIVAGRGQMARAAERNVEPMRAEDTEDPPSAHPAEDAATMDCYIKGARQAWGAFAAFQGATPEFKRVSLEEWKEIFAEAVTHPDANLGYIFVADGFSQEDLFAYEKDAYLGWRIVKQLWMLDGKTNPGYSELLAIFSNFCKEQLK